MMTSDLVGLRALQDVLGVPSKRIHSWHSRRATNGFPEAVACTLVPQFPGDKRKTLLWRVEDVVTWYRTWDSNANRGMHWAEKRSG